MMVRINQPIKNQETDKWGGALQMILKIKKKFVLILVNFYMYIYKVVKEKWSIVIYISFSCLYKAIKI